MSLCGTGDHVLFVDAGDGDNATLVSELIESGARVTCTHEPSEAMASFATEAPSLVVVDLRMPRMKAWAFLREKGRSVRAAAVPTVLLQAPATRATDVAARAAGIVGHIEPEDGAGAVLRFRNRSTRRAADVQLLRAWYRSDLLAELSEALGNALELESMLERVARLLVASFAEWCVIRTRTADVGGMAPSARAHHDTSRTALLDGLVLSPVVRVLDTGRSESHHRGSDQDATAISDSEQGERTLEALGLSSLLVIPLASNGVVLGAVALGRHPGEYDALDRALAEDVAHRIAVALDVSVHHALAQRAARAREDLLAIVSHDLRIPLTTITMVATHVKRSPETPEAMRRDADTILRNLRRMERLIRDLLDCSRLESGRLRVEIGRCNLTELLVQVVEAARPLAGRRTVALEAPANESGPVVVCDRERVLQVLDNLIGNALKFTPEGGTVTVRLDERERDARVVVADTGCGIAPDQVPHLFERYWQGRSGDPHEARRGVGLGLFITKGLVEAQGGIVAVESRLGEGSAFSFTLPLDDAESVPSMRALRPIVVIDDDRAFRVEVAEVLKQEGYDVVGFAHGRAALEYLRVSPPPGLVLMDLAMPIMDGWELATAMDGDPRLALVPVVIVSGLEAAREGPPLRQVVARVPKPTSPESLLQTVAEHCAWLRSGTHRVGDASGPEGDGVGDDGVRASAGEANAS
jgi:signal transduction histidine kinase